MTSQYCAACVIGCIDKNRPPVKHKLQSAYINDAYFMRTNESVYAGLPYSLRVCVYSPRATGDCQMTAGCFYSAAKRSSWLPGIYQASTHGRDELDYAARLISSCRCHGAAAAKPAAGFSAPRIPSRSSWAGCSSAAAAAEPVAGGKVEGCDGGAAAAATAVDALAIRSCTNNDLVGNSQFWQPLQHSAADLGRVWNSPRDLGCSLGF